MVRNTCRAGIHLSSSPLKKSSLFPCKFCSLTCIPQPQECTAVTASRDQEGLSESPQPSLEGRKKIIATVLSNVNQINTAGE